MKPVFRTAKKVEKISDFEGAEIIVIDEKVIRIKEFYGESRPRTNAAGDYDLLNTSCGRYSSNFLFCKGRYSKDKRDIRILTPEDFPEYFL